MKKCHLGQWHGTVCLHPPPGQTLQQPLNISEQHWTIRSTISPNSPKFILGDLDHCSLSRCLKGTSPVPHTRGRHWTDATDQFLVHTDPPKTKNKTITLHSLACLHDTAKTNLKNMCVLQLEWLHSIGLEVASVCHFTLFTTTIISSHSFKQANLMLWPPHLFFNIPSNKYHAILSNRLVIKTL